MQQEVNNIDLEGALQCISAPLIQTIQQRQTVQNRKLLVADAGLISSFFSSFVKVSLQDKCHKQLLIKVSVLGSQRHQIFRNEDAKQEVGNKKF